MLKVMNIESDTTVPWLILKREILEEAKRQGIGKFEFVEARHDAGAYKIYVRVIE